MNDRLGRSSDRSIKLSNKAYPSWSKQIQNVFLCNCTIEIKNIILADMIYASTVYMLV